MKESILQRKSYNFAIKIIEIYQALVSERRNYTIAKQILRSGTSIGANIEEASGSYSRKEFLCKISIAYKEARETRYWIRLLKDSKILEEREVKDLYIDCEELLKIMGSIQRTMKSNL